MLIPARELWSQCWGEQGLGATFLDPVGGTSDIMEAELREPPPHCLPTETSVHVSRVYAGTEGAVGTEGAGRGGTALV